MEKQIYNTKIKKKILEFFEQDSENTYSAKDIYSSLLEKGENKVVSFRLNKEDLSYYNHKAEYVLEPGTFTVMVGGSSLDKDLQKVKFNVK